MKKEPLGSSLVRHIITEKIWPFMKYLRCRMSVLAFAMTLFAINTSTSLGGNVLYVSRDGETFKKYEPVTVSVSGPVGAQDPEGQSCCGGGTDGTWEFYDISDHRWSGQKVTGTGTSATLDTSAPGQITATCTADYRLRCSGDSSIKPIPLSGSGTVTIEEGNGSQGYAPTIEPAAEQFILPHDSEKFTFNLSDEGESGTPTDEDGWTANTSTKRFKWNYSGLQGSPSSGTDDPNGTLELDRDQPGTAQITVKRQDDHDHDHKATAVGNSPASAQVKVKVQEPLTINFVSEVISENNLTVTATFQALDQDKEAIKTGAESLVVEEGVHREIIVSVVYDVIDDENAVLRTEVLQHYDTPFLYQGEVFLPPKGEFDANGQFKDRIGWQGTLPFFQAEVHDIYNLHVKPKIEATLKASNHSHWLFKRKKLTHTLGTGTHVYRFAANNKYFPANAWITPNRHIKVSHNFEASGLIRWDLINLTTSAF